MRTKRDGMARIGGALVALTLFGAASCGQKGEVEEATSTKQSAVSTEPPELAAASIPRFQTQLPRFFTYAPTLTRNAQGQVTRKEFTVRMAKFNEQQLPPGFPSTQLFGYGGDVFVRFDANGQAVPALEQTGPVLFQRTSPGPKFEQIAQRPRLDPLPKRAGRRPSLGGRSDARLGEPQQLPQADAAVPGVPARVPAGAERRSRTRRTRTASRWSPSSTGRPTPGSRSTTSAGPEYVSNDYTRPNSNQSAAFWYHDHAFGVTRLDVGFGLSGFAILRDPAGEPLDRVGNEDILGFEDPNDWISTVAAIQPGVSTNRTQGRLSVSLAGEELRRAARPAVQSDRGAADHHHARLLPAVAAADPDLRRRPDVRGLPEQGRQQRLPVAGRPGRASRTTCSTRSPSRSPPAMRTSVGSSCEDFNLRVTLNVPFNSTGNYLFDNIRDIADHADHGAARARVRGAAHRPGSLVQHRRQRVLSAGGGSAGRHAGREPRRQSLLDADRQRQHQRGQRQGVAEHEREAAPLPLPDAQLRQPALLSTSACRTGCRCGSSAPTAATRTRSRRSPSSRSASPSASTSWSTSRTSRSGRKIVMRNTSQLFPPVGPAPDPNTDGTVMRFTVVDSPSVPPKAVPTNLGLQVPPLTTDRPRRILIQNVEIG